jgi:hypothetical protein
MLATQFSFMLTGQELLPVLVLFPTPLTKNLVQHAKSTVANFFLTFVRLCAYRFMNGA